MHSYFKTFLSSTLLLLLCLAAAPAAMAQDPDSPSEEPPVPTNIEPRQPWFEHSDAAKELEGPKGVSIELRSIPDSPVPQHEGKGRSHLQGDLTQEFKRGVDLVREPPLGKTAPTSEPPENGDPESFGFQNKALVTNFNGINDTGWFPSDAVVASNSSYNLTAVNSGFAVYDSSGNLTKGFTSFDSFFSAVEPSNWEGFHFDPRVAYIASEGQFLMLALGRDDGPQDSYIFLAVSQTSNPNGAWWLYRFTADWSPHSDSWLDFAGLGGDDWGVYFTGNYFKWSGGFKYAMIWSVNPAVYSGGAGNGWQFWNLKWPSGSSAFGLQPAIPHSIAGGEETFFVNTFSGSGGQVLLWKLTGDRTSSPGLTKNAINIQSYDSIGMNVDQPGSATDLHGGDARVGNAAYSQRRVYTALTTDVQNNGTSAGVLTVKLNVDTATAEWQNLTWSGEGYYYFYPAVSILGGSSTAPKLAWFGTWTGPSTFASTLYRLYDSGAAHPPVEFISTAGGSSAYVELDSNGRNRWGDYSGAGYNWSGEMCGVAQRSTSMTTWRTRIFCAK